MYLRIDPAKQVMMAGTAGTYLYNSVDVLRSVETHEVHGEHLKLVCPVLELLNVFLQIQPE